jgi:glycosyltransferase involved in cell wall biosynthesis
MRFDVIIPLKDRTLAACVESLLALGDRVHHILICDGGSTRRDVVETLANLGRHPQVLVRRYARAGFNKAWLINQGILAAPGDWLLVSDADIVWNALALEALAGCLQPVPTALCHVEQVMESDTSAMALKRQRYGYRVERQGEGNCLIIETDETRAEVRRPGCGLVCGQRQTFWQLGGYKTDFMGWGWEDQDLLIRARLLGFPLLSAGQVLHQSHNDRDRNQFCRHLDPRQTRDRNLLICLSTLQQGQLLGDLQPAPSVLNAPLNLQITLPENLRQLASQLNLQLT